MPIPAPRSRTKPSGKRDVNVRKVNFDNNQVVLLYTSAVKVVNPHTGELTSAYAQHDTASQATLISENLKNELGLESIPDPSVMIRTLADGTVPSGGCTDFEIESLYTGEDFDIKDALLVPQFSNDEDTLPHAVDITTLEHFNGVQIKVVPERKRIDILIGQSDKTLLAVLDEYESADPEEPNYVLTRLGPVASGGSVSSAAHKSPLSTLRVQTTNADCSPCDCSKLKMEIIALKETVREYEYNDEVIVPSASDERAKNLVEPTIAVVDGRYEMTVPSKSDIIQKLPDNYSDALKRTMSLLRTALRNPELKQVLTDTFSELIREGWIVPVDNLVAVHPAWHLPFLVTNVGKLRMVYHGATITEAACINQAVLSGENLLNNVVEVLMPFRLGKYACVADLSRCFFQVEVRRSQQDLFRIV